MAPLIFFTFLVFTGVQGNDSVRTPERISVKRGRSVTIPCFYDEKYKNHVKYWCKGGIWTFCKIMVRTDSPQRKGKVSITDIPDKLVFTVTMRNLQKEDTDMYWCAVKTGGIGTSDDGVSLFLTVATDSPGVWTENLLHEEKGGSLTIPCRYDKEYQNDVKYWCKGYRWSSCTTMVRSDSPQSEGEVSIADDSEKLVFTVTMKKLQKKDTDWYWCAVEINREAADGAQLFLNIRGGSSAVPQKTTAKTVIESKVTTVSLKQTTESLTPADEQRAGWTSATNYQRGLTVTVFPPAVSTLSVTEDKLNTSNTPRISSRKTQRPRTLLSLVILGILLVLLSLLVVTRILWKRAKEAETRSRGTNINFTVTLTTDHEEELTYSTLVHKEPVVQNKINKPSMDPSDEVIYSSIALQDTQRSRERSDKIIYSAVVMKK